MAAAMNLRTSGAGTDMSPAFRAPMGGSAAIERVRELVRQVAPHTTLVLIQGESGSGKEVVARAIHEASPRRDKPFVPVNCGAIPADLLESELFGHEKGAFTGAICSRKGRFEMAEGGTLFLDEIGDMSLPMQVKLLRVLQERCFERVGSNQTIHCNVRIIAATHRDLDSMILDGSFRQDLFFRLSVFPVYVPPLRERLDDLAMLIRHFSARMQAKGAQPAVFSTHAMAALTAYAWPGNIRELENLIERMAITHAGKTLRATDLPARYFPMDLLELELAREAERKAERQAAAVAVSAPDAAGRERQAEQDMLFGRPLMPAPGELSLPSMSETLDIPDEGLDLKQHLQDLEVHYIASALRKVDGVVSRAARLLCLQRTTLVEKMKKLGMQAAS